jgi:hypothetical protein
VSDEKIDDPITIIRTKWKGVHPKHFYVAFLHHFTSIPTGIGLIKQYEIDFFHSDKSDEFIYGFGTTPGSALRDMYKNKRIKSHRT